MAKRRITSSSHDSCQGRGYGNRRVHICPAGKRRTGFRTGLAGSGILLFRYKETGILFPARPCNQPHNLQARQALELLETPFSGKFQSSDPQMYPISTKVPAESTSKPTPPIRFSESKNNTISPSSPFSSEADAPAENENNELAFLQNIKPNTAIPEESSQDQIVSQTNETAGTAPAEGGPTGNKSKTTRKIKPITIIVWVLIASCLLCVAGTFFLSKNVKVTSLLPADFFFTLTPVQPTPELPTSAPTDTPPSTPTPTSVPPTSTPTPLPRLVYSPSFTKTACQFAAPEGVSVTCGYVGVSRGSR